MYSLFGNLEFSRPRINRRCPPGLVKRRTSGKRGGWRCMDRCERGKKRNAKGRCTYKGSYRPRKAGNPTGKQIRRSNVAHRKGKRAAVKAGLAARVASLKTKLGGSLPSWANKGSMKGRASNFRLIAACNVLKVPMKNPRNNRYYAKGTLRGRCKLKAAKSGQGNKAIKDLFAAKKKAATEAGAKKRIDDFAKVIRRKADAKAKAAQAAADAAEKAAAAAKADAEAKAKAQLKKMDFTNPKNRGAYPGGRMPPEKPQRDVARGINMYPGVVKSLGYVRRPPGRQQGTMYTEVEKSLGYKKGSMGRRRRRRASFGRYPTLAEMTGWVRPPHAIGLGEKITGMTPRMRAAHNKSKGPSAYTPSANETLLQANNFYETTLGSTFGQVKSALKRHKAAVKKLKKALKTLEQSGKRLAQKSYRGQRFGASDRTACDRALRGYQKALAARHSSFGELQNRLAGAAAREAWVKAAGKNAMAGALARRARFAEAHGSNFGYGSLSNPGFFF